MTRRPIVRHASYINGRYTIGAEVPRPWRRYAANIATVLSVLGVIFAGVWVAV